MHGFESTNALREHYDELLAERDEKIDTIEIELEELKDRMNEAACLLRRAAIDVLDNEIAEEIGDFLEEGEGEEPEDEDAKI